jgi:hypothetical protein
MRVVFEEPMVSSIDGAPEMDLKTCTQAVRPSNGRRPWGRMMVALPIATSTRNPIFV